MAFSLKHYGQVPFWGVAFENSPVSNKAAIVTSASFSASSQKYESVGSLGQKIGAIVYDSECSFTIQVTLLAYSDNANCKPAPDSAIRACGEGPFRCVSAAGCDTGMGTNMCGSLALVSCPSWIFSISAGASLYPVIDSSEFSMSNTDARTASISGTIYAF